jgi:hypothetical protein
MKHQLAPARALGAFLLVAANAWDVLAQDASVAIDRLTNNNAGATATSLFTQSDAAVLAFGNTVVVGYVDSGSNAGGTPKFTGFSYSTNGGGTFTDGGTLPNSVGGDAGDPVLARDETTGRIYLSTLGFSVGTVQVFRSDTNGTTWLTAVNGTPGGLSEDKPWLTVDNFPGPGNGNVYLVSRTFGPIDGIRCYRSTDQGATFGPSTGVFVWYRQNGAFVLVAPDHTVYVFWREEVTEPLSQSIQMAKSTDFGVSFSLEQAVVWGLTGIGINGDLGLTGQRQGSMTFNAFRTESWPHAAVNPISGHLYVTYNDNPAGADKADVYLTMSTNGGTTWSSPVRINDDATTTDQWMPTIAVTPDGSQIGIFYYSRQDDIADNNLFRYRARIGNISGSIVTFGPSIPISDTPSLPEFGRDSMINSVYMGDYNTACATPDGVFHLVWADNRDDLPGGAPRKDPNVYYDKIVPGVTGVPEGSSPLAVRFDSAAPNPFQGMTMLAFDQTSEADVTLAVYSPTGALLKTIARGHWPAGRHQVAWSGDGTGGRPLAAGVYFIRITAGNHTALRKVVKLP